MHDMEDLLYKKQEYLETKITAEVGVARKNAKTNKRAALQVTMQPHIITTRHYNYYRKLYISASIASSRH